MTASRLLAALLIAAAAFAAHAQSGPAAPLQGEVLEVKDVDAYSYLRLKTKDGETWAAVTRAPVKKGDRVAIDNPMVMRNFESKTLKKTFDQIVFGSIADPNAPRGAKPAGVTAATAPAHGMSGTPAAAPAPVKVPKATGPDARTVAEVVAGKATLKGKPVVVHGQVVKVSSGILGKNWLHLQDGSGTAAAGTNDILVTTKATAAVGDIVNVKGIVRTDVDLGSGYAYAVLIEDAALSK